MEFQCHAKSMTTECVTLCVQIKTKIQTKQIKHLNFSEIKRFYIRKNVYGFEDEHNGALVL